MSGRQRHDGHITFCISSPMIGMAMPDNRSKAVNPSLSFFTCRVSRKLSSDSLRCTKPSSISVSSRRRTVVRCNPVSLPSWLLVAWPRVDMFRAANKARPRLRLCTDLYLAFWFGGGISITFSLVWRHCTEVVHYAHIFIFFLRR